MLNALTPFPISLTIKIKNSRFNQVISFAKNTLASKRLSWDTERIWNYLSNKYIKLRVSTIVLLSTGTHMGWISIENKKTTKYIHEQCVYIISIPFQLLRCPPYSISNS